VRAAFLFFSQNNTSQQQQVGEDGAAVTVSFLDPGACLGIALYAIPAPYIIQA